MDLKMERKECMFCPENQDKTPRHVKTNGDYIRIPNDTNWKISVSPNLFPWMIEYMNIMETTNVELSLAQDVDGDRLTIVDEQGNPIGEEYTLVFTENFILEKNKRCCGYKPFHHTIG
jgi:galactose-1-phosphate uridylyltransferase